MQLNTEVMPFKLTHTNWRTKRGLEVRAVKKLHLGAILSGESMYLWTESRSLCQAPLTARSPTAVVFCASVDGLTHDRSFFVSTVEGSVGWNIHGHGKVDQGYATEDHQELAEAYTTADLFVLLGYHTRFAFVSPTHGFGVNTEGTLVLPEQDVMNQLNVLRLHRIYCACAEQTPDPICMQEPDVLLRHHSPHDPQSQDSTVTALVVVHIAGVSEIPDCKARVDGTRVADGVFELHELKATGARMEAVHPDLWHRSGIGIGNTDVSQTNKRQRPEVMTESASKPSETKYQSHKRKADDQQSVWFYFLAETEGGSTAKCKRCEAKNGRSKPKLTLDIQKPDWHVSRLCRMCVVEAMETQHRSQTIDSDRHKLHQLPPGVV
nr:unnamed protein product [Callosobruchus chinensis]